MIHHYKDFDLARFRGGSRCRIDCGEAAELQPTRLPLQEGGVFYEAPVRGGEGESLNR